MQLVLIQSSNSFSVFCFYIPVFSLLFLFLFLFFYIVIFILVRGWGVVGRWTKTRGLRGFSSWIQHTEYDLCPKLNLSQEWNNFSINKHKKFSLLADWKQFFFKKPRWNMMNSNTMGHPGLWASLYFALVLFVFLSTCSFSWDLKWTHSVQCWFCHTHFKYYRHM